jgi:DNA polymerase-3 subunit alpha
MHMLRQADLVSMLRPNPAVMDATRIIGEKIYEGPLPRPKLMQPVHVPSLEALLHDGVKDRFGGDLPAGYTERLDRELTLIREKGFDDYFRFVADVVRWAKGRFLVGPGRGSSGGSLLCYLLGITDVDPIVHGTLFERFLDPSRSDLPDIDVDFPDVARDQVIGYLRDTYGEAHVAKLGTVSEWHGASAINDVARVKDVGRERVNALKRSLEGAQPAQSAGGVHKVTLEAAVATVDACRDALAAAPELGLAMQLEDIPRHSGVHAAGVIVSGDPVCRYGSVDKQGTLAVDGSNAERIGLLKFDALGLRYLSVIQRCIDLAGLEPNDYHNILSDLGPDGTTSPEVWKVFTEDRVTGIFQFDGHAVRELTKKIKVERFSDLCALTSLARPGPLYSGQAAIWCARRTGEIEWEHEHPGLAEITEETYGMIVYQEQAMAVVRELAGFDGAEVNAFRKAMGKKLPEKVAAMRERFIAGFREKHDNLPGHSIAYNKETAEKIFDMLEEYSGYAFNKSHAVAYSMISYVCAWLKAHYPLEFTCAQLSTMADEAKTKALLRELKSEGFYYVPFDIDKSGANWEIIDGKVYGGFTAVRGIGMRTAEACLKLRANDPEGWKAELTTVQRNKLLSPYNTPWHDLTRLAETYAEAYENPVSVGVRRGPVMNIDEIPERKGSYCFIATIRKIVERVKDDGTKFINLYVEDDSGEAGMTINRYKYDDWKWLLEGDHTGKDCLFRADIIADGRKWFFMSKMKELSK